MTHTHHGGCSDHLSHRGSTAMAVDDMAVVRLLERFPIDPTLGERIEAVRVLTAQGRSADHIAAWLRIAERTVFRYRAQLKRKAGA